MIKTLNTMVMIKVTPPKAVSRGGIFIAETAREKCYEGEIVAVSKGRLRANGKRVNIPEVKVGDYVLYTKKAPKSEISFSNGKEFIIMKDDYLLAVITKGELNVNN